MLSRRILRIKVMQVLYSKLLGKDLSAGQLESVLTSRIKKTETLYFIFLQYLIEICNYVVVDAAKRGQKLLPNEGDLNVNIDISNNKVLVAFSKDELFLKTLEQHSVMGYIEVKLVKKMHDKLTATPKYAEYVAKENKTLEDDKDITRYIVKKVIGVSEDLEEMLAEHFINIEDDHFLTLHSIQKIIKEYQESDETRFVKAILLKEDRSEDIIFAKTLLKEYEQNELDFNKVIEPRLKNWDIDRVAVMDTILMKMAICEFVKFPYIPLKVSMNEYIDISKEYSTPKSKDFINGILDKTMRDLQDKGEIKKLGRGLINS